MAQPKYNDWAGYPDVKRISRSRKASKQVIEYSNHYGYSLVLIRNVIEHDISVDHKNIKNEEIREFITRGLQKYIIIKFYSCHPLCIKVFDFKITYVLKPKLLVTEILLENAESNGYCLKDYLEHRHDYEKNSKYHKNWIKYHDLRADAKKIFTQLCSIYYHLQKQPILNSNIKINNYAVVQKGKLKTYNVKTEKVRLIKSWDNVYYGGFRKSNELVSYINQYISPDKWNFIMNFIGNYIDLSIQNILNSRSDVYSIGIIGLIIFKWNEDDFRKKFISFDLLKHNKIIYFRFVEKFLNINKISGENTKYIENENERKCNLMKLIKVIKECLSFDMEMRINLKRISKIIKKNDINMDNSGKIKIKELGFDIIKNKVFYGIKSYCCKELKRKNVQTSKNYHIKKVYSEYKIFKIYQKINSNFKQREIDYQHEKNLKSQKVLYDYVLYSKNLIRNHYSNFNLILKKYFIDISSNIQQNAKLTNKFFFENYKKNKILSLIEKEEKERKEKAKETDKGNKTEIKGQTKKEDKNLSAQKTPKLIKKNLILLSKEINFVIQFSAIWIFKNQFISKDKILLILKLASISKNLKFIIFYYQKDNFDKECGKGYNNFLKKNDSLYTIDLYKLNFKQKEKYNIIIKNLKQNTKFLIVDKNECNNEEIQMLSEELQKKIIHIEEKKDYKGKNKVK